MRVIVGVDGVENSYGISILQWDVIVTRYCQTEVKCTLV